MTQLQTYRVVVIPDLNRNRTITRWVVAQDVKAAASTALASLSEGPVDCIEVSQGAGRGHKPQSKVAFYGCLYGVRLGFQYQECLNVA